MADSYIIMYELHSGKHVHSQAVTTCASLELAEKWLRDEPKGKIWANQAKIRGSGEGMQLVTRFGSDNWSCYYIRKSEYIS